MSESLTLPQGVTIYDLTQPLSSSSGTTGSTSTTQTT